MDDGSATRIQSDANTLVLSASEIGAYTYCPQSWVLDRQRAPHSIASRRRRLHGSVTHQQIGSRVDQLTALELAARIVLCAIALLVVVLAAEVTRVLQVPFP
jgi:hypothetical protein